MDSDAPLGSQTSIQTEGSAPAGHVAIEMEPQAPSTPVTTMADPGRPNYPYHEHTKMLLWRSRSHEDLKSLVDWTKILIGPNCPTTEANLRRRTKINVTIIEHMPNTNPTFISVDKVEELRIALSDEGTASQSPLGATQPTMRLYIVEDLSTDVVELLGSRYNIDPLFFSTQYNFRGYRYRGLSEALRLQVSKKHRKWFHIDNVRIHWDISQSFPWGREDDNTQDFNIDRHLDSHHTGRGQEYTSILSTRTAFWLGKDGEGGPLVGIVLVDPTTSTFRGDYRDKSIPRPTTTSESEQAPILETWYSDIVETSSRFLGNEPFPPGTAINLMAVVYPATIAICAEWLKVCHFYSITLDQVESVFVSPSESAPIRNEIDEALRHLSRLSQYLPNWRKMVVATLEDAMPAAMRLIQPASHPEKKQDDLLLDQVRPDLKRILRNIEELQTQVTRLTERGVAEMQLQAARESLAESHNLARLSWLATVFVPLTFLSGMFSMSQDISSLQVSFKYYFSIGMPLVIGALIVVRWGPDVTRGMVKQFWGAVFFFCPILFSLELSSYCCSRQPEIFNDIQTDTKEKKRFSIGRLQVGSPSPEPADSKGIAIPLLKYRLFPMNVFLPESNPIRADQIDHWTEAPHRRARRALRPLLPLSIQYTRIAERRSAFHHSKRSNPSHAIFTPEDSETPNALRPCYQVTF